MMVATKMMVKARVRKSLALSQHSCHCLLYTSLRLWGYCNTQRLGAQSKIAQNNVVWYNIIVISI